jgi:hypothetical protein
VAKLALHFSDPSDVSRTAQPHTHRIWFPKTFRSGISRTHSKDRNSILCELFGSRETMMAGSPLDTLAAWVGQWTRRLHWSIDLSGRLVDWVNDHIVKGQDWFAMFRDATPGVRCFFSRKFRTPEIDSAEPCHFDQFYEKNLAGSAFFLLLSAASWIVSDGESGKICSDELISSRTPRKFFLKKVLFCFAKMRWVIQKLARWSAISDMNKCGTKANVDWIGGLGHFSLEACRNHTIRFCLNLQPSSV